MTLIDKDALVEKLASYAWNEKVSIDVLDMICGFPPAQPTVDAAPVVHGNMTQREKLIELIAYVQYLGGLEEKLADYLLANGVIVLPCKVGDTVYAAEKAPVIPLSVKDIAVFLEGEEGSDYERIANFGKTVFLTREEAEVALKKMEDEK